MCGLVLNTARMRFIIWYLSGTEVILQEVELERILIASKGSTAMNKQEAGRIGGLTTSARYGKSHYRKIGKLGFMSTCMRYFDGDTKLMSMWLSVHVQAKYTAILTDSPYQMPLPLLSSKVPSLEGHNISRREILEHILERLLKDDNTNMLIARIVYRKLLDLKLEK